MWAASDWAHAFRSPRSPCLEGHAVQRVPGSPHAEPASAAEPGPPRKSNASPKPPHAARPSSAFEGEPQRRPAGVVRSLSAREVYSHRVPGHLAYTDRSGQQGGGAPLAAHAQLAAPWPTPNSTSSISYQQVDVELVTKGPSDAAALRRALRSVQHAIGELIAVGPPALLELAAHDAGPRPGSARPAASAARGATVQRPATCHSHSGLQARSAHGVELAEIAAEPEAGLLGLYHRKVTVLFQLLVTKTPATRAASAQSEDYGGSRGGAACVTALTAALLGAAAHTTGLYSSLQAEAAGCQLARTRSEGEQAKQLELQQDNTLLRNTMAKLHAKVSASRPAHNAAAAAAEQRSQQLELQLAAAEERGVLLRWQLHDATRPRAQRCAAVQASDSAPVELEAARLRTVIAEAACSAAQHDAADARTDLVVARAAGTAEDVKSAVLAASIAALELDLKRVREGAAQAASESSRRLLACEQEREVLRREVHDCHSAHRRLTAQLSAAEDAQFACLKELDAAEAKAASLQAKTSDLKTTLGASRAAEGAAQQEVDASKQREAALRADMASALSIEHDTEQLRSQVSALQAELEAQACTHSALQGQLLSAHRASAELEAAGAQREAEMRALQAVVQATRSESVHLQHMLKALSLRPTSDTDAGADWDRVACELDKLREGRQRLVNDARSVAALNILASSNVLHLQLANEPSQVSQAAVVRLTQQVKETQQRLLAAQRRLQHVSADESMPRASHQGASAGIDVEVQCDLSSHVPDAQAALTRALPQIANQAELINALKRSGSPRELPKLQTACSDGRMHADPALEASPPRAAHDNTSPSRRRTSTAASQRKPHVKDGDWPPGHRREALPMRATRPPPCTRP